jgi:hypothetical protein
MQKPGAVFRPGLLLDFFQIAPSRMSRITSQMIFAIASAFSDFKKRRTSTTKKISCFGNATHAYKVILPNLRTDARVQESSLGPPSA